VLVLEQASHIHKQDNAGQGDQQIEKRVAGTEKKERGKVGQQSKCRE
jgi:hypothetical protein